MRIYLGSDHAGFTSKNALVQFLKDQGQEAIDLGAFSEDPVDYPDIAREVSEKVLENHGSFGVLVCGSGIGMCMAANRNKGIRAVDAANDEMAEMSRRHNDANILCLSGRSMDIETAKRLTKLFLETPFDGGERHVRRINKMDV